MNSIDKPELGTEPELGQPRPGFGSELGQRLFRVISLYDTKKSAASQAKTTPEMLNRYVQGVHRIPLEAAVRLAGPKGVSLDWLATGEGAMMLGEAAAPPLAPEPAASDEALLGNLVEGLERYLAAEGLALRPQPKARVVVLFHRILERRRKRLLAAGEEMPPELHIAGRPVDIATDPDLADIVNIAK